MTPDLLTALIAFAFVSSITPGPNNLMLMASGVNFGLRRTVPHMLGVGIGFVLMVVLVGIGVLQVMAALPWLHQVLRVACMAYILWMAWKIARAGAPGTAGRSNTPMTFLQAAAFQWVNPKAWAMALTAVTAYAPSQSLMSVALVAVIFGLINLPSVGIWAAAGQKLRTLLTNPMRLRVFNITMAVLLIASTLPML